MAEWETIKEVGRAFLRQATRLRAFPVITLFFALTIPTVLFAFALVSDFVADAFFHKRLGSLDNPSGPAVLYVTLSIIFTLRFWYRTTHHARSFAAWVEQCGQRVEPETDARLNWLHAEVDAQRRRMGLSATPDIFLFNPADLQEGSAFAHAGLVDRGRVAIPHEWFSRKGDIHNNEMRGLISHELTHILNRDGLVREISRTSMDVFVYFPFNIILAVLLLFAYMSVLMTACLVIIPVVDLVLGNFTGVLQWLFNTGRALVALVCSPFAVFCYEALAALVGAGLAIVVYASWVARGQETEADLSAVAIAGSRAAESTIRMLERIERAMPTPRPVTAEGRAEAAQIFVRQCLWFVNHSHEGVQKYVRIQSRIVAWIMSLAAITPGAATVRHWAVALRREHPPTERRLHAVQAASRAAATKILASAPENPPCE